MSAMSRDSSVKRSARSRPRPIVLPSMIPDTDSDSDTSADRSASRLWRSVVIRRRTCPTRRVSHHERRHEHQRDRRQPPVEQHHRDDRRDHRGDVRGDRGRGRGDHAVDPADVVGDPRLDLAGPGAGEERERHPLQVSVDGRAQIVHHALADHVGDIRLPHGDRRGHDRDRDHPQHELGQQRAVAVRKGGVEHRPQQERRDHPEPGRDHDQRDHRSEPRLVGREQRDDPVGVALALGVEQRRLLAPSGSLAAHPVAARGAAHPV